MVTITMTEEQYNHIMEGMEFYNRFMCAQPDWTLDLWRLLPEKYIHDDWVFYRYEQWRSDTHHLFFPELTGGIWHTYGYTHNAVDYEIWRRMRYMQYKRDYPDNDWSVYAQDALFTSWEPPMKIEFTQ